jgi:methylated-DNA-[protein]-cysteine S-methyltransferase
MNRADTPRSRAPRLLLFPSSLGWMAAVHSGRVLTRLAFGYPNPDAAARALDTEAPKKARPDEWERRLIGRLQAYASGEPQDFSDLAVEFGPLSAFQRRVYRRCRQIPHGQTLTYGRLAQLAGSPRAARAVGSCMARNRVPLIVPCHRVIGSGGALGGYSAPGGVRLKRRLLQLEAGQIA